MHNCAYKNMKSTEAKWYNDRAMALKELFDQTTLRLEEAINEKDWEAVDAIAAELRSMSVEIEYVCRM